MKNKKTLLIIVIFIVLIAGASVLYNYLSDSVERNPLATQEQNSRNESAEENKTTVSHRAPDFTVVDIDGNQHKLSEFKGKPVILNFWASWCGPCKSEMPDFNEAYEQYKDRINFLMVNLTDGFQETIETASTYVKEQGYSFPVFYDTMSEAAMTYNVSAVPVTFFIDADGNIIANAQGAINEEVLQQGIDMIYSE